MGHSARDRAETKVCTETELILLALAGAVSSERADPARVTPTVVCPAATESVQATPRVALAESFLGNFGGAGPS